MPSRTSPRSEQAAALVASLASDVGIVLKFFVMFSRFEYALKRSSFRLQNEAKANWDTFADSLRGKFATIDGADFHCAVSFLLSAPPETQVVSGADLAWSATKRGDGEHLEKYVLRLVKTVRNNLFHGGKYPAGPVPDVARNRDLLEKSVTVLSYCLTLHDGVRFRFEEMA